MKRIIVFLAFQFLFLGAFAQIDNTFWFAAPDVDASHGDQPIFIRFVALNQNTTVRISQPQNVSFTAIQTTAPLNVVQSYNLTSRQGLLENTPANTVLDKGLLIESDDEIMVYYEIGNGDNAEIFPLKGRSALGVNFRIPAQNEYANNNGAAEIDIVATEDNTEITIVPTSAIVGHPANVPFTITLDKGQTYAAKATNINANGTLAGTKITSNKKIAVTTMDDSLFASGSWDLIGDQIVPTTVLGNQYVAVKGNSSVEKVYIVATEDNTNIFFDGQTTAATTMNDGDLFMQPIVNSSLFVESDKPVYVMHLSGVLNELGDAILPPIGCTGSSKVGFIRTSPQDFDLMVVTKSGNEGSFLLNGNPNLLVAADFQPVPGSGGDLMFTKKNFPVSDIGLNASILTNTAGLFHLGVLSTTGSGATYGYFSDYRLGVALEDVTVCPGEDAILNVGTSATNVLWSTGATSTSTTVTDAGEYWVNATIEGCQISDTITVTVNSTFTIDSQQDEVLAVGQTLPITINLTPNIGATLPTNITYVWSPSLGVDNPNSNDVILSPITQTTYTVTATGPDGCEETMMFTVRFDNATSYGIPNAFAPDGKNTHFKPIVENGVIVKEFMIFNRWGQLMYNETDGLGWDGNVNGKAQPQDTYIYVGQLEMSDGQVIEVKGELLLVR